MRILITGISGFAGSHLADYFLAQGNHEVFGTIKWRSNRENIRHIENKVRLLECDIRDAFAMKAVLEAAASSLDNVVKCSVFLQDMDDFSQMNGVYAEFFNPPSPARAAVEVARLPKDVKVEIEAIAIK